MTPELKAEIDAIKLAYGVIEPDALITYAKQHPTGFLYRHFDWDNESAAHQYRLEQARGLIRQYKILKPQTNNTVRAFVSVPSGTDQPRQYYEYSTVAGSEELRLQRCIDALQRHVSELEDLRFDELAEQLVRSQTLLATLRGRLEGLRGTAA